MRSFQKKLSATAGAAALLAALGAAFAQSSDPLDAHSATADRNAIQSQGTQTRIFKGNDMSTNGPLAPQTSTTAQSSDTSSATSTTTSTDNSSTTSSTPATTDNSSASNTTDNSAAAPSTDNSTPAPRTDRN